jgi:hypothetical protein
MSDPVYSLRQVLFVNRSGFAAQLLDTFAVGE